MAPLHRVVLTYHLHVDSRRRAEGAGPWRYTVVVPDGLLDSESDEEVVRLSLAGFSCYFSWYLVAEGFNTVRYTELAGGATTVATLPPGTYTYASLARALAERAPPGCTGVEWQRETNAMAWAFATPHRLAFDGLYALLGFGHGEEPAGTAVGSSRAMAPLDDDSLVLRLTNLSPYDDHRALEVGADGVARPCTRLATVRVNCPPFQLVTYDARGDAAHAEAMYTADTKLNRLCLEVTNQDGVPLTYLPEHRLTLRVEVVRVVDRAWDELRERVDGIKEVLDRLYLAKAVKLAGWPAARR